MTTAAAPAPAPAMASAMASAVVSTPPMPETTSTRTRRRVTRRVLTGTAVVLIGVELVLGRSWLTSAGDDIVGASWRWALLALVASVLSMVAFGAVRQQTLQAAGVEVGVRDAVSMSYVAGAIHTTLPGGAVFSTAYAFRQLRKWGASASVATWCMAITGVLAAATLALVGMVGITLGGGLAVSATQLITEIAVLTVVLGLLVLLTRDPSKLIPVALTGLRLVNLARRRPGHTGAAQLTALITDLGLIRPRRRHWLSSVSLSLANWLLDAAALWAACMAVGIHMELPALLLTYVAGMAAVSVSPLPAGVGIVEGALTAGLTASGAAASSALAAVLIYRLLSTGGIALVGWSILGTARGANGFRTHRTEFAQASTMAHPA